MKEGLRERIRKCPALPTLPTVALEVLDLARSAEVDTNRLARVIEKDPALAGRMLKTVNSPFYGCSTRVTTVKQSIVVLGLQSVRTLVLGFSLVETLRNTSTKGFDHRRYWRRSFYTASAARQLGERLKLLQQDELFVGGLLADIGMLVLDSVLGNKYGDLCHDATSHVEQAAMEVEALGLHHGEVAGLLLEQWNLPPLLAEPIRHHVEPEKAPEGPPRTMARILQIAGRCADVFLDKEPAPAIAQVIAATADMIQSHHAGDSPEEAGKAGQAILARVGGVVSEMGSIFHLDLGPSQSFDRILRDANEALLEITLRSQREASTLQQQAAQMELAFSLRERELKKAATIDALTGLRNRAEFDRILKEELNRAIDGQGTLSLVMIDLDRFKPINDRHGHQVGDAVLRYVGELMARTARDSDTCARFGGEELAMILPATDRRTAAGMAEHLRSLLAARCVDCGTVQLPVTASFGVATYEPLSPLRTPQLLLKAADMALYRAKEGGRNRVKIFNLARPEAA